MLDPMAMKAITSAAKEREGLPWYAKMVVPDPMNPGIATGMARPIAEVARPIEKDLLEKIISYGARSMGREGMQLSRMMRKFAGPLPVVKRVEAGSPGGYTGLLDTANRQSIRLGQPPFAGGPTASHEFAHHLESVLPDNVRRLYDTMLQKLMETQSGKRATVKLLTKYPYEHVPSELMATAAQNTGPTRRSADISRGLMDALHYLSRVNRGMIKSWLRSTP